MKRLHSASCSCTSCVYRSRSKQPSVQQIIEEGSRIDKLFYGKYLPLRERKLLEKLIRTRAVYDDVRNQLLSTSGSSDQTRSEHKLKRRDDDSTAKNSAVLKMVDLVDRGQIGSSNTSKLSSCCSCCSCSSMRKIKKRMEKHPRVHRHHVPHEKVARYTVEAEKKGRRRQRKLSTRISSKIKSVRFKMKQIRSDPCRCTFSLNSMIKRTSKAFMKKVRSKEKSITNVSNAQKDATERKALKKKLVFCSCKIAKLSVQSFQKVKNIRKSKTKSSGTQMKIQRTFRIKKDSLTLFREKLRKKQNLKDWECEPGTCIVDECIPEQCFIKIKARGVGEKRRRKYHSRISGTGRDKALSSIRTQPKKAKKTDSRVQAAPNSTLEPKCECKPKTKSASSMTTLSKSKSILKKKAYKADRHATKTLKSTSSMTSILEVKASKSQIKNAYKTGRHKIKTSKTHETEPVQATPKPNLGQVICECKPSTKSKAGRHKLPFPRECEPSMCIPYECDPENCARILLSRSKSRGRSVISSTDSLRRKSTGSTTSSLKKISKPRYIQSKSTGTFVTNPKDVLREPPPVLMEKDRTAESSHPQRQAVRISSNFSFNIEFNKDKSPGASTIKTQEFAKEQKRKVRQKVNKKNKERGHGTRNINSRHISSQTKSSESFKNIQVGHRLKRCFCTLKLLQKKKQKVRHAVSKKTMASLHIKNLERRARIRKTQTKSPRIAYVTAPITSKPASLQPHECECAERIKERNRKGAKRFSKETNAASTPRKSTFTFTPQTLSKSLSKKTQSSEIQNDKQRANRSHPSRTESRGSSDTKKRQAVRIGSSMSFNIEFSKQKKYQQSAPEKESTKDSVSDKPIKQERRRMQQKGIKVHKPRVRHAALETTKNVKAKQTFLHKCFCTPKLFKKNKIGKLKTIESQQFKPRPNYIAKDAEAKRKENGNYVGSTIKRCFCTLKFHKKGENAKQQKKINVISKSTKTSYPLQNSQISDSKSTSTKINKHMYNLRSLECDCYEGIKRRENKRSHDRHVGTDRIKRKSVMSMTTNDFSGSSKTKSTKSRLKQAPKKEHHLGADQADKRPTRSFSPSRQAVRISSNISFNVEFFKDSSVPSIQKKSAVKKNTFSDTKTVNKIKDKGTKDRRVVSKHRVSQARIIKEDKASNVGFLLKRCFCTLGLQKKNIVPKTKKPKREFLRNQPITAQFLHVVQVDQNKKLTSNFVIPHINKRVCSEIVNSHNIIKSKCTALNKTLYEEESLKLKLPESNYPFRKNMFENSKENVIPQHLANSSSFTKSTHFGSRVGCNVGKYQVGYLVNDDPQKTDPFYQSFYAFNLKVSKSRYHKCEPGDCLPYKCDTIECSKISGTDRPKTTPTAITKKSKTADYHLNKQNRKGLFVGTDFNIDMRFFKDKNPRRHGVMFSASITPKKGKGLIKDANSPHDVITSHKPKKGKRLIKDANSPHDVITSHKPKKVKGLIKDTNSRHDVITSHDTSHKSKHEKNTEQSLQCQCESKKQAKSKSSPLPRCLCRAKSSDLERCLCQEKSSVLERCLCPIKKITDAHLKTYKRRPRPECETYKRSSSKPAVTFGSDNDFNINFFRTISHSPLSNTPGANKGSGDNRKKTNDQGKKGAVESNYEKDKTNKDTKKIKSILKPCECPADNISVKSAVMDRGGAKKGSRVSKSIDEKQIRALGNEKPCGCPADIISVKSAVMDRGGGKKGSRVSKSIDEKQIRALGNEKPCGCPADIISVKSAVMDRGGAKKGSRVSKSFDENKNTGLGTIGPGVAKTSVNKETCLNLIQKCIRTFNKYRGGKRLTQKPSIESIKKVKEVKTLKPTLKLQKGGREMETIMPYSQKKFKKQKSRTMCNYKLNCPQCNTLLCKTGEKKNKGQNKKLMGKIMLKCFSFFKRKEKYTEPAFKMILNRNNMNILNKDQVLRNLDLAGKTNTAAQQMKVSPPLIVIDKNDASIINSHDLRKTVFGKTVFGKKSERQSTYQDRAQKQAQSERQSTYHDKAQKQAQSERQSTYQDKAQKQAQSERQSPYQDKARKQAKSERQLPYQDKAPPKYHGRKCKCCYCRNLKGKHKENAYRGAKPRKFKRCICGSVVCEENLEQLKAEKKIIRRAKQKPCVCGSDVCYIESAETPEMSLITKILQDKMIKAAPMSSKAYAKMLKTQAKNRIKLEKIYQQERKQRKKAYAIEDAKRYKLRAKQDKKDMDHLRKYKNVSDILKVAESLQDLIKCSSRAVFDLMVEACRIAKHPRDGIENIKDAARDPKHAVKVLKRNARRMGFFSTMGRIKQRLLSTKVLNDFVKKMEAYPITNFIIHLPDEDPKKRMKKFKKKRFREPVEFHCSAFMGSLRKRPCLRVYVMCPWFYPHCMSLLVLWRQFVDIILFILAIGVWSPCILCMELFRFLTCFLFCQA